MNILSVSTKESTIYISPNIYIIVFILIMTFYIISIYINQSKHKSWFLNRPQIQKEEEEEEGEGVGQRRLGVTGKRGSHDISGVSSFYGFRGKQHDCSLQYMFFQDESRLFYEDVKKYKAKVSFAPKKKHLW